MSSFAGTRSALLLVPCKVAHDTEGGKFPRSTLPQLHRTLSVERYIPRKRLKMLFDRALSRWRSMVTNLDETRQKIIWLLGDLASEIYGLQKKFAGM